jgi:hypothetical protein
MRNYPPTLSLDFGFRISDFPPTHPLCDLQNKGAMTGGAWHPDSREVSTGAVRRIRESACLASSRGARRQKTTLK